LNCPSKLRCPLPNEMGMSDAEYIRLHQPLLAIDAFWEAFSNKINGSVICNYHGRLERRIAFQDAFGVRRAIVLGCISNMQDANGVMLGPRYSLSVGANSFSDHNVTSWNENIAMLKIDEVDPDKLAPLMNRAWELIRDFDLEQLKLKGTTTSLPTGIAVYRKDSYMAPPSIIPKSEP
jgi:hypothetical protein